MARAAALTSSGGSSSRYLSRGRNLQAMVSPPMITWKRSLPGMSGSGMSSLSSAIKDQVDRPLIVLRSRASLSGTPRGCQLSGSSTSSFRKTKTSGCQRARNAFQFRGFPSWRIDSRNRTGGQGEARDDLSHQAEREKKEGEDQPHEDQPHICGSPGFLSGSKKSWQRPRAVGIVAARRCGGALPDFE